MSWTDHRTGLCGTPEPGPGPWPLADVVHRFRAGLHLSGSPVTVAGAALSVAEARSACVGEAAERYAALVPREPEVIASETELADGHRRYVPAASLGARPSPLPDEKIAWLTALDGRLVPLEAARGNLVAPGVGTPSYSQGSTGLAAGPTADQALHAGAAEVIERDAVARAWSAGTLRPAATDQVLPAPLLLASGDAGLEAVVHLLPTGCPSSPVAFVGLRDPRTRLVGVGAAYRSDVTSAVSKAWVEAVVSIAQAAELTDPTIGPPLCEAAGLAPWRADRRYAGADWSGVTDLAQHAQLLLDPDLATRVWALLGDERSPAAALPRQPGRPAWDLSMDRFDDVVAVDLTTSDLRAAGDLTVVRVLAVGARTVRPAGISPEKLPCPLI